VREGDRIDVHVSSNGAASSLRGGRLFVTPLTGPIPGSGIFALAQGPIVLEDPSTPTTGVVEGGAIMEADLPAKYIENGRFTLVLDDASATWAAASNIAKIINDSQSDDNEILAVAVDPKNVVVTIPTAEMDRPDSFISRVQQLPAPIQSSSEARVQINERTGTMIVSGDVEIDPVVISHKGLTISTIDPKPTPTPRTPVTTTKDVVALDTAGEGGAKLQDLVAALEQLRVPAEDRIVIIKKLHKIGKLHAKLIIE
jgi:flagellar P-ring protein precursor FlgI